MPTLPRLSVQIEKGINSECVDCGRAVDRRSTRCRHCHSVWVAKKMYPPWKRPKMKCRDCGNWISQKSAKGKGRCKMCDIIHRRNPAAYDMYSHYNGSLGVKEQEGNAATNNDTNKRSAFRQNPGSSYYDKYGSIHYADESLCLSPRQQRNGDTSAGCYNNYDSSYDNVNFDDKSNGYDDDIKNTGDDVNLEQRYTVASAWASLRKCWKGFKIAQSNGDCERMAMYAERIRNLRRILNLPAAQEYNNPYRNLFFPL